MEKVKVTAEVEKAIKSVMERFGNKAQIVSLHTDIEDTWSDDEAPLNNINLDTLIRALYIGLEVQLTPEEKLAKYYLQLQKSEIPKQYRGLLAPLSPSQQKMNAIKQTLKLLDIKVKGINA